MNIELKEPKTLTLKPETIALILDLLALNVVYARAKPIIEDEIIPQLKPPEVQP